MKTAILTGFNVFGNYSVNPTEILARSLDGKILAGHLIYSIILPTTVLSPHESKNYGRQIVKEALSIKASAIISLGMASEAKDVRIETTCINWLENDRYCTEYENCKPIDVSREPREKKLMRLEEWNIPKLFNKFTDVGISFEISENAGSYCCNALMYRTLCYMQERSARIPFMFAHVPCTEESIVKIVDFDRKNKTLFLQEDLVVVVEKFLETYVQ